MNQYRRWFAESNYPDDGTLFIEKYQDDETDLFEIYFPPETIQRLVRFRIMFEAGPCDPMDRDLLRPYVSPPNT